MVQISVHISELYLEVHWWFEVGKANSFLFIHLYYEQLYYYITLSSQFNDFVVTPDQKKYLTLHFFKVINSVNYYAQTL